MTQLHNSTTVFKLNTGATIPAIGLGTWRASKGDEARQVFLTAIKAGYRHIDTAHVYGNEKEVGEAIREAISQGIVKREDLFVTTKLWNFNHRRAKEALNESLERLGLDYVDLYLVHWPFTTLKRTDSEGKEVYLPLKAWPDYDSYFDKDWDYIKTWQQVQELVKEGKTKAVGVSNYTVKRLKKLIEHPSTKVIPSVNQVQLHQLLPEIELVDYAKEKGVVIEAYSPLGSNGAPLLKNELAQKIAEKNGIPVANLIFSWIVARGIVVLPKSATESRIISNLKIADLPQQDLDALTKYAQEHGGPQRIGTSTWVPDGLWEDSDL